MKRYVLLILLATLSLFFFSCKGKNNNSELPNPFAEFSNKEDAEKEVGFSITSPDGAKVYRVLKDTMIELLYENGMCIRKSTSDKEDISGVYNTYSTVLYKDGVVLKGDNNIFYLATWKNDKYSYSIYLKENGVSEDELQDIVSSVK